MIERSELDGMKNIFINVVEISKRICKLKLNNGDIAVDCTMGNGNDTAFLCQLVGDNGKVYAFDIQEGAVINTRKKLQALDFFERAEIILLIIYTGHENGKMEKAALESFTSKLSQKEYNVANICFANQINNPPELICIEKVCPK